MGLLDGLLGGGGSGGGAAMIEQVLMAALSNQGGAAGQATGPGSQGAPGGMLGGLLSNFLGGGAGGAAGAGAGGGLQSLVSAFTQNGMGHIAQSWVGNGANQPVSPDQVQTVFGDDKVQAIADQTGMPKQDVLSHLAQMLPGVVDRLTQGGHVPT